MAQDAKPLQCYALFGNLGAGKSFFARSFINALQREKSEILSPTFNLVYSYETKIGKVFHFDLYRLKNASELENIGFFEALHNSLTIIEWPEIAMEFLPKNLIEITIKNIATASPDKLLQIANATDEISEETEREIIVNYGKKI